jgi:hypothetical protein
VTRAPVDGRSAPPRLLARLISGGGPGPCGGPASRRGWKDLGPNGSTGFQPRGPSRG